MADTQSTPTPEELASAARILSKLEPGFLPYDIFMQISRLSVSSVVEIVPLRLYEGRVQVLLLQRPADDPYFPGQLHTPGTIVLASDREGTYADAFQRLLERELGAASILAQPQYVTSILHKSKRGMEDAKVYFVEMAGEPALGAFYDINSLPDSLVESQAAFIKAAAHAFIHARADRHSRSARLATHR